MPEKEIDVFIQNLKSKTTVLQQLIVCIEECKKLIGYTENIKQMIENLDIESANSKLNELETSLGNLVLTVEGIQGNINNLGTSVEGIQGAIEGIQDSIGDIQGSIEGIQGSIDDLENHNLYEYGIGLSFEDDDNHSYYVETTIIDENDYEIGHAYTYNDIISILHLGQPCYESDIGDPCFIYGIGPSAIEFMWYNGTSLATDATPQNLSCTITKKREIY